MISDLYETKTKKTPYEEHDKKGVKTGRIRYDTETRLVNKITEKVVERVEDEIPSRYIHMLETEGGDDFIGIEVASVESGGGGGYKAVDPKKLAEAQTELSGLFKKVLGKDVETKLYLEYWSII